MNGRQYQETGEINLARYIDIMIRRKWIVLGIFLISIITAVISAFGMSKAYRATSYIMLIPPNIIPGLPGSILSAQVSGDAAQKFQAGVVNSDQIIKKSGYSLATHVALLKSNIILGRVIDKVKSSDASVGKITHESLDGVLTVKEKKDTNILQLEAMAANPKIAKELANTWAEVYISYNQELISGEIKGAGNFITDQFEIAKNNLVNAEEKVKEFVNESNVDLMDSELRIKKDKLNRSKRELAESEMTLKTQEDYLKELNSQIVKQDRFIVISKAISDDALWQQVNQQNSTADFSGKKLKSEEINPIYQKLANDIVNTEIGINTLKPKIEYLKRSISVTEKEADELEIKINQRQFELTQLERQVDIYKRTYNSLSSRIEEARLAKTTQLGEIKLVSPAIEPLYPSGPSRRNHVVFWGVAGLAFGILSAFSMEFWKNQKKLK